MSLSNKLLGDEWEALAAREASAVARAYERPRYGATAALDTTTASSQGIGGSPSRHQTSAGGNTTTSANGGASKYGVASSSYGIVNASLRGRVPGGPAASYSQQQQQRSASPPSAHDSSSFQQQQHSRATSAVAAANASSAEVYGGRGALLRVPCDAYPTIEDAVFAAKDGDCVFLDPIPFTLTEPLLLSRNIHIIGIDEVGACATLSMNGGLLRPPLPLLRVAAGATVHLKGLTLRYSHNEAAAPVDAVSQAYCVFVSDGGAAVLDEVRIISSCGGIRGTAVGRPAASLAPALTAAPPPSASGGGSDGGGVEGGNGTYITATCCKFECDTTAVQVEGRCFLDRCTVAVGARGVAVQDGAAAKVEGCGFVGGAIGIDVQRRGRVTAERNAFVDVAIGVNLFNSGIRIPQPSLVRGNEFRNPTETAVRADGDGAAAEIAKNLIHAFANPLAVGIEVRGGKPEVSSNVVKDCLGTSIASLGGAALIEGNVIENGSVGICVRNSRPTVRLNEVCQQRAAGICVESSAIPYSHGMDVDGPSVLALAAPPAASSSSDGADGPNVSAITSNGGDKATSKSGQQQPVIHPLHEADPHVEANSLHGNYTNLRVCSVTGTFLKNDLAASVGDNVALEGRLVVPIVLSGNAIGGSLEGCGVLAANGVEAHITDNMIAGAKVAAVMLRGSGFCEVKSNTMAGGQTAFVAMGRAVGRFTGNIIAEGMGVDVYTDSQPTVTVVQ